MKHRLAIALLIAVPGTLLDSSALAQAFRRGKDESNADFASRIAPDRSVIVAPVISATWNRRPVIIAFYSESYRLPPKDDPDQQEYFRVRGFVYQKAIGATYRRYLIDTLDTAGGTPAIESVFFANADDDAPKELLLIVSWEQRHAAVNGTLFGTFVYDDLATGSKEGKLRFLKAISKRLDGGCDCTWDNGKTNVVKRKTAGAIKAELKRLGY